ncbi:Histone-lysine N-methyltransferase set9 [Podila epigama]|nr:Histone-lysine N-methyltransferase set9 [Podila epigama]
MDLQTLSVLDDLLSDVLLDGVHLWFKTHKMNKDYQALELPEGVILDIIQKKVIIDRRLPDAANELLKIEAIAARLTNKQLLQNFRMHARRYLSIYLPSAGFEISQTDRYTALTNKSEACVIATRAFEAGHELRFCSGSIANLTPQEERDLEKKTSDFSVIRTSRRGTCLFLGPARFVNHDCDPNCKFMSGGSDVICFKALRPIEVRDEITTYYGDNYFGTDNQDCMCVTCELLGQGWFRKTTEPVAAVESSEPNISSLELDEGPPSRRLRSRSSLPTTSSRSTASPVSSDTIPHVPFPGPASQSFIPNSSPSLVNATASTDPNYSPTSSWSVENKECIPRGTVQKRSRSSCEPTDGLGETINNKSHDRNDKDNNDHNIDNTIDRQTSVTSSAATTLTVVDEFSSADGLQGLSECLGDLSLTDCATESSVSTLSTPSSMDLPSDVDIDRTYKDQSAVSIPLPLSRARMSISFLCHSLNSSPTPSPGTSPRPSPQSQHDIVEPIQLPHSLNSSESVSEQHSTDTPRSLSPHVQFQSNDNKENQEHVSNSNNSLSEIDAAIVRSMGQRMIVYDAIVIYAFTAKKRELKAAISRQRRRTTAEASSHPKGQKKESKNILKESTTSSKDDTTSFETSPTLSKENSAPPNKKTASRKEKKASRKEKTASVKEKATSRNEEAISHNESPTSPKEKTAFDVTMTSLEENPTRPKEPNSYKEKTDSSKPKSTPSNDELTSSMKGSSHSKKKSTSTRGKGKVARASKKALPTAPTEDEPHAGNIQDHFSTISSDDPAVATDMMQLDAPLSEHLSSHGNISVPFTSMNQQWSNGRLQITHSIFPGSTGPDPCHVLDVRNPGDEKKLERPLESTLDHLSSQVSRHGSPESTVLISPPPVVLPSHLAVTTPSRKPERQTKPAVDSSTPPCRKKPASRSSSARKPSVHLLRRNLVFPSRSIPRAAAVADTEVLDDHKQGLIFQYHKFQAGRVVSRYAALPRLLAPTAMEWSDVLPDCSVPLDSSTSYCAATPGAHDLDSPMDGLGQTYQTTFEVGPVEAERQSSDDIVDKQAHSQCGTCDPIPTYNEQEPISSEKEHTGQVTVQSPDTDYTPTMAEPAQGDAFETCTSTFSPGPQPQMDLSPTAELCPSTVVTVKTSKAPERPKLRAKPLKSEIERLMEWTIKNSLPSSESHLSFTKRQAAKLQHDEAEPEAGMVIEPEPSPEPTPHLETRPEKDRATRTGTKYIASRPALKRPSSDSNDADIIHDRKRHKRGEKTVDGKMETGLERPEPCTIGEAKTQAVSSQSVAQTKPKQRNKLPDGASMPKRPKTELERLSEWTIKEQSLGSRRTTHARSSLASAIASIPSKDSEMTAIEKTQIAASTGSAKSKAVTKAVVKESLAAAAKGPGASFVPRQRDRKKRVDGSTLKPQSDCSSKIGDFGEFNSPSKVLNQEGMSTTRSIQEHVQPAIPHRRQQSTTSRTSPRKGPHEHRDEKMQADGVSSLQSRKEIHAVTPETVLRRMDHGSKRPSELELLQYWTIANSEPTSAVRKRLPPKHLRF